jgi:hypothetical protein
MEIMRRTVATSIFLMLALTHCAGQRNVEQIKDEANHAQGGRQAKLAAELAEYLTATAGRQFIQGSTEQAQATVRDILKYAEMAHDAALKSRDQMKQTEIKLRETQRHLEDLRRTLPVDDMPPLVVIEKKIEQFRQDLLDAMFSPRRETKAAHAH